MVDINTVALELMSKDDATAKRIINKSTNEYFKLLKSIAEDIYDSCIAVYYASYTPKVYKRHGYPEGHNLYQANDMTFENGYLSFDTEEYKLMKYGSSEDKRRKVLDTVMKGFRGTKNRIKLDGEEDNNDDLYEEDGHVYRWPMSWKKFCTYPNQFSKYQHHWQSTKNTMDDIFEEFSQKGLEDTNMYYWQIVAKYV